MWEQVWEQGLEVRAGSYGVLVPAPPPQAGFREFLLKLSLFVMRRSEDRPEFDWPCRT